VVKVKVADHLRTPRSGEGEARRPIMIVKGSLSKRTIQPLHNRTNTRRTEYCSRWSVEAVACSQGFMVVDCLSYIHSAARHCCRARSVFAHSSLSLISALCVLVSSRCAVSVSVYKTHRRSRSCHRLPSMCCPVYD